MGERLDLPRSLLHGGEQIFHAEVAAVRTAASGLRSAVDFARGAIHTNRDAEIVSATVARRLNEKSSDYVRDHPQ